MRPSLLNPLFAPVTVLPGIANKVERLYRRLFRRDDVPRVIDLLFHLPTGAVDRRAGPKLNEVTAGSIVTVAVEVTDYWPPPPNRPRAPFRVVTTDRTADLVIVYFSTTKAQVERLLPLGSRRHVSGTVEFYDGVPQMVHPDRVMDDAGLAAMARVEPVYPLTEGLSPRLLSRHIMAALAALPAFPEWLEDAHVQRASWPDFAGALAALHRPEEPAGVVPSGKAWSRLAYDELLANQLALALVRSHMRRPAGRRISEAPSATAHGRRGVMHERLAAALPFRLTPSQETAIAEIVGDLEKPERMLRLLQGDVGSGKTVVALFACAAAIAAGGQAAIMAPTEILARQHYRTIAPLAQAAGIRAAILTGRERGHERTGVLDRLGAGEIDLLIGTHALFSDDVAFRDLALAAIDEQHRFGVNQRLALARKGHAVDMLVMTATPIPRSLLLAWFGDMDLSELRDKPAGRQPIDTRALPLERLAEMTTAIGRAMAAGRRAYWVCPLIAESETVDLAAAQTRFEALRTMFGAAVDMVHGRMKAADKDAAMARFAAGETRLLVATTAIEVGVDVADATVMVIEQAERFGLAQLHQLRGRIGRGAERSTCLMLYQPPLGEAARTRLAVLRETEDGFRIAEEDLRLRGEGDVLGKRQSGLPGFRIAQIEVHHELMKMARDDAALVLARDPALAGPRGQALRILLYLFEREEAVRLIASG
jgi:ATP-dependent DNA helicase RecG